LKVIGFNAAVARQNGYQVRTDGGGHQYSVKVTRSGTVESPQASLGCGGAYLDYEATGQNKQAWVYSGWYLNPGLAAAYFYWRIAVVDSAGVGDRYWNSGQSATGWYIPTGWLTTHSVTGYSWAEVSFGQITLTNGNICEVPPGALVASTTLS
jgi:hypothetical protein